MKRSEISILFACLFVCFQAHHPCQIHRRHPLQVHLQQVSKNFFLMIFFKIIIIIIFLSFFF